MSPRIHHVDQKITLSLGWIAWVSYNVKDLAAEKADRAKQRLEWLRAHRQWPTHDTAGKDK